MPTLSYDLKTGFLHLESTYEYKEKCAACGFKWSSDERTWTAVFSMAVIREVKFRIPEIVFDKSVSDRIPYQMKREKDLLEMKKDPTGESSNLPDVCTLKIQPFPYQKLGIQFIIRNGKGVVIGDQMGLGKGQVLGSKVYTPKGPVKIEDIRVGDLVIGKNGKPTIVTGVFPQPIQDVFKVTFNDGFSLPVDGNHLWEVNLNYNGLFKSIVLSTNQLLDKACSVERNGIGHNIKKVYPTKTYYIKPNGDSKWCIPISETVEFKSQTVEMDPYLLGVFIGDGNIRKNGSVNLEMEKKDLKEMRISGRKLTCYKKHMLKFSFLDFKDRIKIMGLAGKKSYQKFIPSEYKYNTSDVRLGILQGLMDTDGYAGGNATEYCTTSKQLCDDVCEIVQSLGGVCRVGIKQKPSYMYKGVKKYGRPAYRVNIKLPCEMKLFRLSRKLNNHDICYKYLPARYILNIEKQEKQEATICISVDAPDQLYVSEHCIVTHNTIQGLGTAVELKRLKSITGCIIVTPASLKFNWPIEIEKFTNEKCVIIDGVSQEKRLAKWLDNSAFFKIVNYELLSKDLFDDSKCKRKKGEKEYDYAERARAHAYRRVKLQSIKNKIWDLAIFDEIHCCKNYATLRHRACKALKAKIKIGLSGTPMDGKLEEIYNVMDIIAPGQLGSRVAFSERHIVTDFFGNPTGYKDLEGVKNRISPFFIRRMKSEVLKQLPDKIYETKVISLTDEEMKIYNLIKDGEHVSVLEEDKVTHEMVPVDPMVRAIRCKQFCNLPQMIEPKCKSHSKMDIFMDIIEEIIGQGANKAVIFSQYKQIIDVLDAKLKKAGYKFLRIDGDTPPSERAKMQEVFNTDKTIDCIIGTEAMSTGLNLVGASYVINYDDNWQPSIMAQRADRIHRIGQKESCTIISFVCKGTIEEKIRGVLYAKDKISSDALGDDSDESVLRKLGKKEMASLL